MLPEAHPLRPAQNFLLALYAQANPDDWVEFRAILSDHPKEEKLRRTQVEATRVKSLEKSIDMALAEWITKINAQGYDIYFGACARRSMRRDTRGNPAACKKEDVAEGTAAWVDYDQSNWKTALEEAGEQAGLAVASGRGLHLYFLYPKRVPAEKVEQDCALLQKRFGGDTVANADRLLRIPGTTNWKHPEGLSCRLVKLDPSVKWNEEDFKVPEKGAFDGIPWDLRTVIIEGHDVARPPFAPDEKYGKGVDRSQVDFRVMKALVKMGITDDRIVEFFTNPEYGISAKVIEEDERKGNGVHYFEVTLRQATAAMEAEGDQEFDRVGDLLAFKDARGLSKAPKPQWAVEKILPVGGMMIISGPAKAGKSLLATDLLLLLSGAEGKFLERFQVRIPGPAAYLQAEISESSLKYRANTIGASRNILWEELPLHFYTGRIDLGFNRHVSALAAGLKKIGAKYVVVDPLARFHLLNENKQRDMARVLAALEAAGKEAGILGIVLVHHHGKPSSEGPQREGVHQVRGASVIGDWGNAHVILQKRFSESTDVKYIRVTFELRDADEPAPLTLALDKTKLRFRDFSESEARVATVMGVLETAGDKPRKEVIADVKEQLGTTNVEAERLVAKARTKTRMLAAQAKGDNGGSEEPSGSPETPAEA